MAYIVKQTVNYPVMARVRQPLVLQEIENVEAEVAAQLRSLGMDEQFGGGRRIAITAGSRGICNIARITKAIADYIKNCGGKPFIVPAMGTHGGATAEGQTELLSHYGITEEAMGCPICAAMDVVHVGDTEEGFPVYLSKVACESDGIIVCNRVKPHTDFVAENESGLLKMITIGLGKQWGANFAHGNGLAQCVKSMAQVSLKNAPIIAGLAIVENALDHTYLLQAVKPENFVEEDARLLKIARGNVPQIPADELDLLVVKEIGKEYSGTGMDTKVIGRMRIYGEPEPLRPRIRTIVALRISPNSHGNATGIGLADLTTQALVDQIRKDTTYTNILATTFTERGKIPMHLDTEEETINYAFNIGNAANPEIAKVAIVENTLHLGTMLVSKAVLDEHPELEVLEENVPLAFDEQGMLITPIAGH